MPWIDLDKIDLNKFMRGNYTPPNYYNPLSRTDLRYLFPNREYEISLNIMDNEIIKNYFDKYRSFFLIPDTTKIEDWNLEKSSYMPGPGNRRPTNSVIRYLIKDQPFLAYVAKIGNYLAGKEEFEKQEQLYQLKFPTPRPFYWENGAFIDFFKGLFHFLNHRLGNNAISAEEYNEITRTFDSILAEKEELYVIKQKLKKEYFSNNTGDFDEVEMLLDYWDGEKLQFASILWMEFKFSTSFEVLIYNAFGGKELDNQTGTSEFMLETPTLKEKVLINEIPKLIDQLWKITTHNDLKGEHIRYDQTHNVNEFIMIDWGTPGGGTKEYFHRDLGILLYDVSSFVIERGLFSRKFTHQLKDPKALEIERDILSQLEDFWSQFLAKMDTNNLNKEVIERILKLLERKKDDYVKDARNALMRIDKR